MKSLHEGLMDIDDISANIEKGIIGDWLKNNIQSKYKYIKLKNGTLKVWGDLVIKKVAAIAPLNISKLEGNIYIEDCGITSLEGIFAEYCNVSGDVNITGCPNLTSLAGLPHMVDGSVSVMDCKSIRSLDDIKCLAGDVYLVKCGKRFKKSAVEKAFPAAINIHCSEEDMVPNLTEAFSDPILTLLWQQFVDTHQNWHTSDLFLIDNPGMIKSSMCRKFTTMSKDDKERIKTERGVLSSSGTTGIILLENHNNEFVYLYNSRFWRFDLLHGNRDFFGKMTYVINDIEKMISKADIKTIYIYGYGDLRYDYFKIRDERMEARKGMIDVRNKEAMRKYLREQQQRYKTAVEQIRATKNTDQYKNITSGVEKLMERFTKMINKTIRDTKWAEQNYTRLGFVYDAFGDQQIDKYERRYGVLTAFKNWSRLIVQKINGTSTYGDPSASLKTLTSAMANADRRLKDVGM